MHDTPNSTGRKVGWKPGEWAEATGISRAQVYVLLKQRELESVKLGASRIITTTPTEYLASLAVVAA